MYVESVFATVGGLGTLTFLRRFEDRGVKLSRRRLALTFDPARVSLAAIVDRLAKLGATVSQESYERAADGAMHATLEVRMPVPSEMQALVDALERDEGVRALRVQQL
jgi:hypothetical protein